MVSMLRSQPDARAVVAPQPPAPEASNCPRPWVVRRGQDSAAAGGSVDRFAL